MRIGILTLPLHTNYGGILQAYALQTILECIGHEAVVLDKSPYRHLPLWKMPLSYPKRILEKYILGETSVRIFAEQWHNRAYPIISQYTQMFIDTYIHRREVNDLSKLDEKDFEAIVVGSDQIWRVRYYPKIENAFLDFAQRWKQVKRVAYAPSFGTDVWEYSQKQTERCKLLLQKFDAVSVRESSAVELCAKYFECEATHVLDPTLLLNVEDYMWLVARQGVKHNSNMLLQYILDEDETKKELVECIANEKGLNIVRGNSKVEDVTAQLEERIQPAVEQWLCGFQDADFVITDSFHACVFSIIYNKPFIVYGNEKRGYARFLSLLSLFGLEDRLVTNQCEALNIINKSIDWERVNHLRDEMQKYSISFLVSSLDLK